MWSFSSLAPCTNEIPMSFWNDVTHLAYSTLCLRYAWPRQSLSSLTLCWWRPLSVRHRHTHDAHTHSTSSAPYFANCLSAHDLDELNIEIIRNTLYKAYLEDFYQFCQTLDGPTAEVMGDILRVRKKRSNAGRELTSPFSLCSLKQIVEPSTSPSTHLAQSWQKKIARNSFPPLDVCILKAMHAWPKPMKSNKSRRYVMSSMNIGAFWTLPRTRRWKTCFLNTKSFWIASPSNSNSTLESFTPTSSWRSRKSGTLYGLRNVSLRIKRIELAVISPSCDSPHPCALFPPPSLVFVLVVYCCLTWR